MKKTIVLVFTLAFLASCSKSETQQNSVAADSITTQDSTVSDTLMQSPDADTILSVESTAYDTDSISKSK